MLFHKGENLTKIWKRTKWIYRQNSPIGVTENEQLEMNLNIGTTQFKNSLPIWRENLKVSELIKCYLHGVTGLSKYSADADDGCVVKFKILIFIMTNFRDCNLSIFNGIIKTLILSIHFVKYFYFYICKFSYV